MEWGTSNYVNPPFRKDDVIGGNGPTAFVRKAIAEQKKGKTSVIVLPVPQPCWKPGLRYGHWGGCRSETWTAAIAPHPANIACFILRGKSGKRQQRT
jgi:hypothetical protein